jgi:hypothetical protein
MKLNDECRSRIGTSPRTGHIARYNSSMPKRPSTTVQRMLDSRQKRLRSVVTTGRSNRQQTAILQETEEKFADPDLALERVADALSVFDLRMVLQYSALLSLEDISDGDLGWAEGSAFYPVMNMVTAQHFSRAILASDSDYSGRSTTPQDVLKIMSELEPMYNGSPEIGKAAASMSLAELKTTLLAPMYRQQTMLDARHFIDRMLRSYALLVALPKRYETAMRTALGPQYIDVESTYRQRFGLSVTQTLSGGFLLWMGVTRNLASHFAATAERAAFGRSIPTGAVDTHARREALEAYLMRHAPNLHQLEVKEADLVGAIGRGDLMMGSAWLRTFAGSITSIRNAMSTYPYVAGNVSFRALPFERYPLVRLPVLAKEPPRYILPNARSFARALPDLPAHVIMEQFTKEERQSVHRIRGLALEYYLHELLEDRLKEVVRIPEITYIHRTDPGRRSVKSPDLTMLESGEKALIIIEAKGKEFSPRVRTEQGVDYLATMDAELTRAVINSAWKIADLFDLRIDEFLSYRDELNEVNRDNCLTVLIYAENLPMFLEGWRERIHKVDHPLHAWSAPFVALSLEEFEWFVDAASAQGLSLYRLLHDHQARFWACADLQGIRLPHSVENYRKRSSQFVMRWAPELFVDTDSNPS